MLKRRWAYANGTATTRGPVMGSGLGAVARVIMIVGTIVAAIIVAGIIMRLLGANGSNAIVSAVMDAARWLVGPFRGMFSINDPDWRIIANWGLAAAVYLVVSRILARLIAR
jgi:hypothetical protein